MQDHSPEIGVPESVSLVQSYRHESTTLRHFMLAGPGLELVIDRFGPRSTPISNPSTTNRDVWDREIAELAIRPAGGLLIRLEANARIVPEVADARGCSRNILWLARDAGTSGTQSASETDPDGGAAREAIRALIEKVVVHPDDARDGKRRDMRCAVRCFRCSSSPRRREGEVASAQRKTPPDRWARGSSVTVGCGDRI